MVLFSILKLIHGGILYNNKNDINMLMQNKYYVIPVVNVDGLAYIERQFKKTGIIEHKRKNNHFDEPCKSSEHGRKTSGMRNGVDLNRNYASNWGVG